MTNPDAEKLLEQFAAKIGEHFDCVQVLVSWTENGHTKGLKKGVGNWYARQGLAHEFINEDVAQENARQLSEALEPPPDDTWKTV